MKESRLKETSSEVVLEDLARRLLVMVRDSEKRDTDLRSDIAQKIKETEVLNEDK